MHSVAGNVEFVKFEPGGIANAIATGPLNVNTNISSTGFVYASVLRTIQYWSHKTLMLSFGKTSCFPSSSSVTLVQYVFILLVTWCLYLFY